MELTIVALDRMPDNFLSYSTWLEWSNFTANVYNSTQQIITDDIRFLDFIDIEEERKAQTDEQVYALLKNLMLGKYDQELREEEIFEDWQDTKQLYVRKTGIPNLIHTIRT